MVGQKTMELNLANVRIQAHQKIIIIKKCFRTSPKKENDNRIFKIINEHDMHAENQL